MALTLALLVLAGLLFLAFRGRKARGRDDAAEAARRAVEARLGRDAAPQEDEDSHA